MELSLLREWDNSRQGRSKFFYNFFFFLLSSQIPSLILWIWPCYTYSLTIELSCSSWPQFNDYSNFTEPSICFIPEWKSYSRVIIWESVAILPLVHTHQRPNSVETSTILYFIILNKISMFQDPIANVLKKSYLEPFCSNTNILKACW